MPSRRGRRLRLLGWLLGLVLVLLAAGSAAAGWSVGRENGAAWLYAPNGTRFYSRGVNIVQGFRPTDTNRNGTRLDAGVGFCWTGHYPSLDVWRRDARGRLRAWGFNTRGAWSDPSRDLGLALAPDIELGRNAQLHWFDPFSPEAPGRTLAEAHRLLAPYAGDPLLLGVFTDNEAGWWNSQLFRYYLVRPPDNHTKQRLLALLREWYGNSWERLAADFAPQGAGSFADLARAGAALRLRPGGRGIAVVNAFTRVLAARYYQLVHDAVKTAAPGVLVLGDRLPLYFNQDAVLGMRDWVDVISTNSNVNAADGWVAPWYFESLDTLSRGRPVLVSEWFCAAVENRSGNRNNGHLLTVSDQQVRAAAAAAAQENFAGFPNVVGTHWFQLYDEPLGGRADGEDYNFGLIDRHNAPYAGLTARLAGVNARLDAVHAVAAFADPGPTRAIHRAGKISLEDAAITDWDKRRTRVRRWAVAAPYAPFGDVHLAWSEQGLYLLHLAQNHLEPPFLDYAGEFPWSESYRIGLALDAGAGERRLCIALSPTNSTRWAHVWEITPRAWMLDGGGSEPAPGLVVRRPPAALTPRDLEHFVPAPGVVVEQLPKPLPHIALEAFIPAAVLGVAALRPGQELRLGLDVRGFFREKRMSFPGPAQDPFGPDGPVPTTPLLLEE